MKRDDWLLFLQQLLAGGAFGLWRYILPIHIRDLGATPSQVGFVLSIQWMASALTLLPAGLLADRINRKRLAVLLTLIPIIPTLLLSIAGTWQISMLLLIPIGFHVPIVVVILTYLTHSSAKADLRRIIAMLNFGFLLGEFLMRSVGARIAEHSGFGLVFQVSSLTFLLSVIPILLLKPQLSGKKLIRKDYRPLLRSRNFIVISLFSFFIFFIMQAGQALIPNYLQEVVGLELSSIGDLGALSTLAGALLSLVFGGIGFRRGLIGAQIGFIIAIILILALPSGIGLIVGFFFLGSFSATYALTDALMSSAAPTSLVGLALGVQTSLISLGNSLGPVASGLLYDRAPSLPLIVSALGLCVLILFTFLVPQPEKEELLLKKPPNPS
jgi:MFS family permease